MGERPGELHWTRLSDWAIERPLWAAWIAATLIFTVFFSTLDPTFDTPDDAFIMFVLDGFFYGEPDYHTSFVSTLLTRGLARLYASVPGVPWYGFGLYGLHFSALVAWLYLFLRQRRAPGEVVLFAFGLLTLSLPMMLEVSFTSAALVVGAMGILLHFEKPGAHGSPLVLAVMGGAMAGLAHLTRADAFPALLLLLVPMLVFRARAVPLRHHALALSIFLALALGGRWADSSAYGSPEWQGYLHRVALGAFLIDSPRLAGPDGGELVAKVGWSENDLALYRRFIYADPDVYGVDALAVLARETAALDRLGNPLRAVREEIIGEHLIELLLLVLYLVIFLPRMSRLDRWIALALAGGFGAGALYLATFLKFPSRVALPTTWMVVAWVVVAPHAPRELMGWIRSLRTRRIVVRVLAFLLFAVPLTELGLESRENTLDREGLMSSLRKQQEFAPGSLVVALSELPFDILSPLTTRDDLPPFDYVGLGWRVHSPLHTAHLEGLGIENVYLAPIERPDTLLAIHEDLYPLYARFVREHYQREPALEPLLPIDGRMYFYGKAR